MTDEQALVEVTLQTMAYGGSALGRADGRVVFIPYTIPGETVLARLDKAGGRVAFGRGETLLDASTDRVMPECPHFGPGECGGCHWQHIASDVQPLIKQDVLADQLERVGNFTDPNVLPIIPAPEPWAYNHRMTWTVSPEGTLGFPADGGGLTPIEVCHVLLPALQALYETLDIATEKLESVELIAGDDHAQMVVLRAREEEAPEMEIDIPGTSVNLLLPDGAPVNLAGDTHVSYTIKGRRFRVTAGSAFRANVAALPALVDVVIDMLGDARTVIDLYAGVGLFGTFAAERADYVTLVESFPPAATDADENTADLEHIDLVEGDVVDVLPVAEDYEAAIVNPPAEGVEVEALDALGSLPRRRSSTSGQMWRRPSATSSACVRITGTRWTPSSRWTSPRRRITPRSSHGWCELRSPPAGPRRRTSPPARSDDTGSPTPRVPPA